MTIKRNHTGLLTFILLSVFLLSGCAGTGFPNASQEQKSKIAVETETQTAPVPINQIYQQALTAFEENNYPKAVEAFRPASTEDSLSDFGLYYYADALYKTENYAEAIKYTTGTSTTSTDVAKISWWH
ncbi:hypothetical protein [Malonomonas rubra]|uniref:hypothetical protein n=1 Tax=Malonomonas rubra TaxID=57040 RepID=UPI0026F3743C|nr:hypothetical protein [Malonomonas rubra]